MYKQDFLILYWLCWICLLKEKGTHLSFVNCLVANSSVFQVISPNSKDVLKLKLCSQTCLGSFTAFNCHWIQQVHALFHLPTPKIHNVIRARAQPYGATHTVPFWIAVTENHCEHSCTYKSSFTYELIIYSTIIYRFLNWKLYLDTLSQSGDDPYLKLFQSVATRTVNWSQLRK